MGRRRFFLIAVLCALAFTAPIPGQQPPSSAGAPEEGWSGTATIRRHGTGQVGTIGRGVHLEEITFTLRPDGTASYNARYEWRIEVPVYAPVKASGSSSGETSWGLGFVAAPEGGMAHTACVALLGADKCQSVWEVGAAGGEVRGTYDSTSVSQSLADWFVNALQAPELRQTMPPVLEDDVRTIPGFQDLVNAPADARTLSGGSTRTIQQYAEQNMVPVTEQVTWSITKGRVDAEPRVTIYGPACGCVDADDPGKTPLVFTAGATRQGGEFSEFEIASEAEAPTVLTNDPGAARLELTATPATGPVVLRVRYALNGRRYESKPFRLEFCAMKSMELENEEADLNFDSSTSELQVNARQQAWHNGRALTDQITWEIDKIGAPTIVRSEPQSSRGERIRFTYTGLPRNNADFGPKKLTAAVNEGQCACTRTRTIRAFFDADSAGNPDGAVPNWYYYWRQTDAVPADARGISMTYRAFIPMDPLSAAPGTVAARWDGATEQLLIGSEASQGCAMPMTESLPHVPSGRPFAEGIDCFAELVRHELQHRQDFIEWWSSPQGPHVLTRAEWLLRDPDLDLVPTVIEDGLPGCKSGLLPSAENKHSCDARPRPTLPDAEIRAYYAGWMWPLASINHADWSCGGVSPKQWKGRSCR